MVQIHLCCDMTVFVRSVCPMVCFDGACLG